MPQKNNMVFTITTVRQCNTMVVNTMLFYFCCSSSLEGHKGCYQRCVITTTPVSQPLTKICDEGNNVAVLSLFWMHGSIRKADAAMHANKYVGLKTSMSGVDRTLLAQVICWKTRCMVYNNGGITARAIALLNVFWGWSCHGALYYAWFCGTFSTTSVCWDLHENACWYT